MSTRATSHSLAGRTRNSTIPMATEVNSRAWVCMTRSGSGNRLGMVSVGGSIVVAAERRSARRASEGLIEQLGPLRALVHELGQVDEDQILRHRSRFWICWHRI